MVKKHVKGKRYSILREDTHKKSVFSGRTTERGIDQQKKVINPFCSVSENIILTKKLTENFVLIFFIHFRLFPNEKNGFEPRRSRRGGGTQPLVVRPLRVGFDH